MKAPCPHLGSVDDRNFRLVYSSYENRCYAIGSPQKVPHSYQLKFCLSSNHALCPAFAPGREPAREAASPPRAGTAKAKQRRPLWPLALTGGLMVLLVSLAGLMIVLRSVVGESVAPAVAVAPSPTARSARPVVVPTLVPSPSPTLAPTATPWPPTPTPPPSPTPAPPSPTPTPTAVPDRPPADGPPTRIVAPAIGLDQPIIEVGWETTEENGQPTSVWVVADYAVGFHRGSAYPGHVGNTVLSGHHNIKGEVFRYVVDLQPGDEITLYVGDVPYRYAVTEKYLLADKNVPQEQRFENAKWIGYFPDERLTLVTCWPYENNTHRVIVVAKPVP